jgi:hypothetical protein
MTFAPRLPICAEEFCPRELKLEPYWLRNFFNATSKGKS